MDRQHSTLTGASQYCSQLMANEQQLQTLVSTASYNAVTMASGATDLINEAGTAKITGEEERYSNTDFVVSRRTSTAPSRSCTCCSPT